jgi:hypothetical protein
VVLNNGALTLLGSVLMPTSTKRRWVAVWVQHQTSRLGWSAAMRWLGGVEYQARSQRSRRAGWPSATNYSRVRLARARAPVRVRPFLETELLPRSGAALW